MTTISARVIEDSISSETGVRLTTMKLRYPFFIHQDFMTHRAFSRNASSSRAIPISRLIGDIEEDPAEPIDWLKNKPGMQAGARMSPEEEAAAKKIWRAHRSVSIETARSLHKVNLHKQWGNAPLLLHSHINVQVTATDWDNFFELRDHPAARPEIEVLAQNMRRALSVSIITRALKPGEWHLPWVTEEERQNSPLSDQIPMSIARSARVSYETFEGRVSTLEEDQSLTLRLIGAKPLHSSPAEHQAQPAEDTAYYANFKGWRSYRFSKLELR